MRPSPPRLTATERRILVEAHKRRRRRLFTAERFLFGPQSAVWFETKRFCTVDCSRRSGKTDLAAFMLLYTAMTTPGAVCLYVAPTRVDARDTLWARIKELNRKFFLGFTATDGRMNLTHPNGSEIRLRGAKNEAEAQRLRGPVHGYSLVIIDEAQNYATSLRTAIADVILPGMTGGGGVRGRLVVMGTPALVPFGYWHDLVHDSSDSWAHHHWTLVDNPHLQDIGVVMAEAARALGGEDSISFRREWKGEWVADPSALVFHFDEKKNLYTALPGPIAQAHTIIAIDLGHHPDVSAVSVDAWWPDLGPELYAVDEWVAARKMNGDPGADLDDVWDKVTEFLGTYKTTHAVLCDEGGLGKLSAETARRRRHLPIEPAEKDDKVGAIAAYNADMHQGLIKHQRGSRSVLDMAVVRWDPKAREQQNKLVVAKKPHSDILDCRLYAHRRARHYLHQLPPAKKSVPDRLEAAIAAEAARAGDPDWLDRDAALLGL